MKLIFTVLCVSLMGTALSTKEVTVNDNMDDMTIEDMESVFARSDEAREAAMTDKMKTMTVATAVSLLDTSEFAKDKVTEVKNIVLNNGSKSSLRKQPKGYAGLAGARKLLNDMIYEAFAKYDKEILRCVDFYSDQCAQLAECRGQISAANYIAANGRSLVLDSQSRINWCETEIPVQKYDLKMHNAQCTKELARLNARLKIVLGDIAIMTTILEMTDCDAKKFMQMPNLDVMNCVDQCTKKSFITFTDKRLQNKVNQLKSKFSAGLLKDTFADLFDGVKGLQTLEATLLQTAEDQAPVVNVTNFTAPPEQRVEVPTDPCDGAPYPSADTKRAAKCTLSNGQCYKLQERFLLIQSGMEDERDQLQASIQELEAYCDETRTTIEAEISDAETMVNEAQTKLAKATETISTAMETARHTAAKNYLLDEELKKEMKKCNDKYIDYEGEICALKKIRGELYKLKGGGVVPFFQDCEVGKWEPEECSATCAGGIEIIKRKTLTHANGGAKCLPLADKRNCNMQPCPIDCILEAWSGWGKCSAECGEGVEQRLREVKQAMKHKGIGCGKTSETRSCHTQACEKDCVLSGWTKWGTCSKDCNGGTQKRTKWIKEPSQGEGKCADKWSDERLEYKNCNMIACQVPAPELPPPCNSTLDIVLLLDGSGSLGRTGWKAEIHMAEMFVDAFGSSMPPGKSKTNMAVVLYSGPRTWSGVDKCTGEGSQNVDQEKVCKIKTITHFSHDMKEVKDKIHALEWPQGSTLTSLALMTAKAELNLGGKDSKSVVIVITDGRPLSLRSTSYAARALRKAARLVWVPVTKYAPLKFIKKLATRRWQENIVQVQSFADLKKSDVVTQLIADICPVELEPPPLM